MMPIDSRMGKQNCSVGMSDEKGEGELLLLLLLLLLVLPLVVLLLLLLLVLPLLVLPSYHGPKRRKKKNCIDKSKADA